jgi:hypothetical protein
MTFSAGFMTPIAKAPGPKTGVLVRTAGATVGCGSKFLLRHLFADQARGLDRRAELQPKLGALILLLLVRGRTGRPTPEGWLLRCPIAFRGGDAGRNGSLGRALISAHKIASSRPTSDAMNTSRRPAGQFPVVVIGASAGALDALRTITEALPRVVERASGRSEVTRPGAVWACPLKRL